MIESKRMQTIEVVGILFFSAGIVIHLEFCLFKRRDKQLCSEWFTSNRTDRSLWTITGLVVDDILVTPFSE